MKTEARAVSWAGGFLQALQCQSLAGDLQVCSTLGACHLAVFCACLQGWGHVLGNEEWQFCSSQLLRVRILPSGVKGLCAAPHAVNVCYHECH